MPEYATEGSAGVDLRACLDQAVQLEPEPAAGRFASRKNDAIKRNSPLMRQ